MGNKTACEMAGKMPPGSHRILSEKQRKVPPNNKKSSPHSTLLPWTYQGNRISHTKVPLAILSLSFLPFPAVAHGLQPCTLPASGWHRGTGAWVVVRQCPLFESTNELPPMLPSSPVLTPNYQLFSKMYCREGGAIRKQMIILRKDCTHHIF